MTRTLTRATPASQLVTMRIALHAKSTAAASPPPPPPTPSKPTVAQIFAQYGAIGMGVYGTISMTGFGALYAGMATGLLDTSWVLTMVRSYVDVESYTGINLDTLNPMYTNFALAYLANIFLEPVRIFGTVYFTPKLGRWWQQRKQLTQQATTTPPVATTVTVPPRIVIQMNDQSKSTATATASQEQKK